MTETADGTVDAKKLYYNLINQLGMEATDGQGNKLRQHPRFSFDSPERTMLIQIDGQVCALNDISVGGISFLSSHNLNVGHRVEMDFEGKFTVKANIMRVVAQDRDEESTSKAYLHGCQFLAEGDGYRSTVLVLNELIKLIRQ